MGLAVILAVCAIGFAIWPKKTLPLSALRGAAYIERIFADDTATFCAAPRGDGTVEILDLSRRGRVAARLATPFAGSRMNVIIDGKGTTAIVNCASSYVAYDIPSGKQLFELKLEEQGTLVDFMWAADDVLLQFSTRPDNLCERVLRINGRTGAELARFQTPPMWIYGITVDGKYLAGYDAVDRFSLLPCAQSDPVLIQGPAALKLCVGNVPDAWEMFSPGGEYYCEVSKPGSLHGTVSRCDTGEAVYRGEFKMVSAAVFCMDGKSLFLSTEYGYTKLNFLDNTSSYVLEDIAAKYQDEFNGKSSLYAKYDKATGLLFAVLGGEDKEKSFYVIDTDRGELILAARASVKAESYYVYAVNGRCLLLYYAKDAESFSVITPP